MDEMAELLVREKIVFDPNDPFRYYQSLQDIKELKSDNKLLGEKINKIRSKIITF